MLHHHRSLYQRQSHRRFRLPEKSLLKLSSCYETKEAAGIDVVTAEALKAGGEVLVTFRAEVNLENGKNSGDMETGYHHTSSEKMQRLRLQKRSRNKPAFYHGKVVHKCTSSKAAETT